MHAGRYGLVVRIRVLLPRKIDKGALIYSCLVCEKFIYWKQGGMYHGGKRNCSKARFPAGNGFYS